MKVAQVIPLYKAGAQDSFGNYRPISLLPNLSKIYERAMYNRLEQFLEKKQIISPSQFGFRKMHSTGHALVNIVEPIKGTVNGGNFACGLFLFFKGFRYRQYPHTNRRNMSLWHPRSCH